MKKINKKRKNNSMFLIYIVMAAVIFMVAGYALLSQTITISGTATADADFNVIWQSASITNSQGSTTAEPTITADTTLNIAAELTKPGDYVEITAVVQNTGAIAAEITNLTPTEPTGTDIVVTYTPDFTVAETLAASATKQVVIKIEYAEGSTNDDPINETFGLDIEYTQQ